MALTEHSLLIEVVHPDGRRAQFTRIRIDTELKTPDGQSVLSPLVQLEDDARRTPPYLLQYKLKDPSATIWLVLVNGNKEERLRVDETQHRYLFGERQASYRNEADRGEPIVVQIVNHYHREVTMAKYNITGGNQGAVGDKAKAEHFVQHDERKTGLTPDDLSRLMGEFPTLLRALTERAKSSEQFEALSHVKAAEEAAQKNDTGGVLSKLKGAGSWVLEVAKSVGAEVIAKVIEGQIGLG